LTDEFDVFNTEKDFYRDVRSVTFAVVEINTRFELEFIHEEYIRWVRIKYKNKSETYRIISEELTSTCGVRLHKVLVIPLTSVKNLKILPETHE
jgi:hypothetical protein